MSQRSGRRRGHPGARTAKQQEHGSAKDRRGAERHEPERQGPGLLAQIGLLVGVFLVVTAIAEVAGASSLGVAAAIGQMAFAIALVAVILRAP